MDFGKKVPMNALYPLRGKKRNFKYAVFDIETSNWINFELLGFYDGENYHEFDSVKDFLGFLLRKKYYYYRIFAHAGGRFDFNFIIDSLERHFPDFKYEILSGQGISEIKVYSGKKYWVFMDSYKLLPKSLRDLTNSFEVEHVKKYIDYDNITMDREKLGEYLRYDVMGLYEVISKFENWLKKYDVPLQSTLASQSIAMYRATMKKPITCLKPNVENFVRKTYTGGRVEIFKMVAHDKIKCYDFTSLYPYCMVKYPMPIGNPTRVNRFYPEKIGFYKADVKIPDVYVPPLPLVDNGKLIFPYGNIRGYFTSKELEILQDIGGDINVHYGYVFSGDYIFTEYINDMYEKKKNAKNSTERLIFKLLLNSSYGKFAQKREKEKIVKCNDISEMIGMKPYNVSHGLFLQDTYSNARFIIPSIASWIASCARHELYNAIKKVRDEHLYYVDTDSVFTDRDLKTGNNLGDLKLEYEGDEAIFLLPKLYAIRSGDNVIIKAKGFEKSFIESHLSFASFKRALKGNTLDFNQSIRKFASAKESLRRNDTFISMINMKKSIRTRYDKRRVLVNYDTCAWKYPEKV